ncbi:DMT family transporter [Neorhizobium sp. T786]|uniref:DMT family transporter n=1 Tax=Pseudorhizobium xiangyangii TaxID=2883104 RepID=UPI001CFFF472|nr:DMT family transporter [Neorhizobium xiangyangii]MCB5200870.1 DMT family transporter [Neorhizobium xiangyangii]
MTSISNAARAPEQRAALACLVLGGIAIGASPIFVRLSEVGPISTGFWRLALALIPLSIWSIVSSRKDEVGPVGLRDYLLLILPGLTLAVDLVAWHISLHMTSVANATLLANLAPVFVTLIGWFLFKTVVSRIFLLGLGLAIAGVVTLKGGPAALADGHLTGDAIAVLAAAFYACYILAIGRLRSRFGTNRIMIWSSASAALSILPFALYFEGNILPFSLYGWAIVAGLAFISHAGGQVAITYALAYLPAAFSSLTLLLQPVVAAILAWWILAEAVTPLQATGGIIVLIGILVARRG